MLERGLSPDSETIRSLHNSLKQFLAHHEKRLENCIRDKDLSIDLKELGEPANIIRWAFPLRREKLSQPSEKFQYFAAHALMCHQSLDWILDLLEGDLRMINEEQSALQKGTFSSEIASYTRMIRAYLHVNTEATAIREILENFEYYFEKARESLRCEFQKKQEPHGLTSVLEIDMANGARDLLLSHGAGRFASVALLREAIELTVQRTLLDTEETSKFKGFRVDITELRFSHLINTCKTLGWEIDPSTDAIDRIYDWGNLAVHYGISYSWEEPWYVCMVADFVRQGVLRIQEGDLSAWLEKVIDYLLAKGKIKVV